MSVRLRNFPPVPDINTAGICTSKCFCSWGSLLTANWLSQTTYPMFAGLRTFIFQHCVILEIHWQKIWLRQFLCHWFTSELTMSTQLFTDKQILKDCNLPKTQSPCLKGSIAIVNWWTFTWTTLVARSVIELFYVSHKILVSQITYVHYLNIIHLIALYDQLIGILSNYSFPLNSTSTLLAIWNNLPVDIRLSPISNTVKRRLKSYLFTWRFLYLTFHPHSPSECRTLRFSLRADRLTSLCIVVVVVVVVVAAPNHVLRGSVSTVLTATDAKKIVTVDYVRETTRYANFGANPLTGGFWANG